MTSPSVRRGAAPTPGWAARMRRTERALAEAAVALFIAQGYESTTVDEIAEAAGVSRRTFFRYFPTKEEVVLRPMLDEIDQLIELLEARPLDESVLDSLRGVAISEKRRNPHLPTALQLYRALRYTPQLRGVVATFVDHFRASIAAWAAPRLGLPVDDLRVQLLAAAATAARETAMRVWVEGGGAEDLPALVDEAYGTLVAPVLERAAVHAGEAGA